jgi:hypothetical protein
MCDNSFANFAENCDEEKPYIGVLFGNKIYQNIIKEILASAYRSYQISKWMSLLLFVVGVLFLMIALFQGIKGDANDMVLILGGLGTANIIALLVYRPLERIQTSVDGLAKSTIASLSFLVHFDYLAQYLVTMSGLAIKNESRNLDVESERVEQLMKVTKEYLVALSTKAG